MFDRRARDLCRPAFERAGGALARRRVSALSVTTTGWLLGVGACVAVGLRWWVLALVGWWANRLFDGLDGALARRVGATDLGGYLDVLADFSIYSGFVVALAVAEPSTRLAGVVLLGTYYLSGAALLTASALLERRGVGDVGDRSLTFLGGLAEGLETVLAYSVILVVPSIASSVEWIFAAMVLVTAVQRVAWVRRALTRARPLMSVATEHGIAR